MLVFPNPKSVPALPELDTCLDFVSTALANPSIAMLRRVFFIAEDKSKFVSVGFHPARGYHLLAEFGGAKKLPLLLNAQQLQTMADIAALCNGMSTNEHLARRAVILTHWHTQPAVRRSEPSMSFAFNSSLLSVDGMTYLLPFES